MNRVNQPQVPLEKVLSNILLVVRRRPVVSQSLFPAIDNEAPPEAEVVEYARRLQELKTAGAQISLVQIYSATRPASHSECGHLPLKTLRQIARTVREMTGLSGEVF